MNEFVALGPWSIAWALLMVFAVIGVSIWQRLGLVRTTLVAMVRTLAQLTVVGYVIGWVFKQDTWYVILGLLVLMTLTAGHAGAERTKASLGRRWWAMIPMFTLTLGVATAFTLIYVTQVVVGVEAWSARYLVPLGGIILGNMMTACSLGAERLLTDTHNQRLRIETILALGGSPNQAIETQMQAAFRAAMTPTINAMMIVGIVKLPGVMTGQMLGGQDPLQAALYQIVVMFMLAFGDAIGAGIILIWLRRRLFTAHAQLRNNPQ